MESQLFGAFSQMARAYYIDPSTRTVSEIEAPLDIQSVRVIPLTMAGDVLHFMASDTDFFILHPFGAQNGKAILMPPEGEERPTLPFSTMERTVVWISTLMVINNSICAIPARNPLNV